MELILFRHGIAVDFAPGMLDAERPLTEKGVHRTQQAAVGLAKLIDPPDMLMTSPKLRAKQTADLLGHAWNMTPAVLEPLARTQTEPMLDWLVSQRASRIILVGHEPQLSELAQTLCVADQPQRWLELKKAAAIILQVTWTAHTRSAAELTALLPPRALRALARS